ncbi:hypothetical protein ACR720_07410 [Sphingomonas parapaucimobilis]|uniref:hypothetical protein n=1 Tax=Sphingomonas parapaucimobilis TaxID=28213 RepID=UPI0039E924F5
MIDSFALLLTHGLMLVAAWRLVGRRDLDQEGDIDPAASRHGQKPTTKRRLDDA